MEKIIINNKILEKEINNINKNTSNSERRNNGKYWSGLDVSKITNMLLKKHINNMFIFEPFVGGGSLVRNLVNEFSGIVNDVDKKSINILEKEWKDFDWKFYRKNILKTSLQELYNMIPNIEDKNLVIYTNPPFGTVSTNKLSSNKNEIITMEKTNTQSRNIKIEYGFNKEESKYIGDTYGRGDLCIPCIGKMIEIIKNKGKGYLTFFSPFGIFLGRKRYLKLFMSLLRDFEFIYGEVFSGEMFDNVSKIMAISFTIWKYNKNCNTDPNTLSFIHKEKTYNVKNIPLLKDGWKYNTSKIQKGEIVIQHNDTFNSPVPKIYHMKVEKGGSEMIQENVIKSIGLSNIPDPLIYGIWSTLVGKGSCLMHPNVFNECYTHLPDFNKETSIKILSYGLLSSMIRELKNNYCNGKIGFDNGVLKFGGEVLTDGALYLIDKYKDLPIGENYTIGNIFERLKNEDPDKIDKKLRILIKKEIEIRLDKIGYWEYLPIPFFVL